VPVPLRFPFPPYATNTGDATLTEREREQGEAAFEAL
jgi:hypothetical protein